MVFERLQGPVCRPQFGKFDENRADAADMLELGVLSPPFAPRTHDIVMPLVVTQHLRQAGSRPRCSARGAWLVLAVATGLLLFAQPTVRADLWESRAELWSKQAQQIEELATWCEAEGLAKQAEETRAWLVPYDPLRLHLVTLPEGPGSATDWAMDNGGEDSSAARLWREKFAELRRNHATALMELARGAIHQQQGSLAFELVLEAAREDNNLEAARQLLGYLRHGDGWYTPYALRKMSKGQVWHEQFGWLPEAFVPRYEAGERYYRKRWISAEEDARLHPDIQNGWVVETEHYRIVTDHSIEGGVELGKHLERLYRVWQQVFVGYDQSLDQLANQFDGRTSRRGESSRKYRVVYFRDRDRYVESLRRIEPLIDMTIGIYFNSNRTAYFFAGDTPDLGTIYHEASHQLFSESRPTARDAAERANFWIVEAIALYMESMIEHDTYVSVGGDEHVRVRAARHRLLVDDFYVPLSKLTRFGRHELQTDSRIGMLYSQCAGLSHFLMHYDGGRYREAVVRYLLAVYTDRATPSTLAQLTGMKYAELDRQYREFMQQQESTEAPQAAGGVSRGFNISNVE